jgi:hypothetical protein
VSYASIQMLSKVAPKLPVMAGDDMTNVSR